MATVAHQLAPVMSGILGSPPALAIEFWDGSRLGPDSAPATVQFRTPDALRRILYAPGELGFARAYVHSDIDVAGDVHHALRVLATSAPDLAIGWRGTLDVVRAAVRLKVVGRPLPPPPEEARLRGRLHSVARDAEAISHHYDVSNDFYELILGPSMTYSCARFTTPGATLEEAQAAKYELVCRKLGLAGRVEIRLQDYRDVSDGPFDAISSIGMFEHVGMDRLTEYFTKLFSLLPPEGRLLNHGISRPAGPSPIDRNSFIARYVFPDGGLHEVGTVVSAMQEEGFEVRDVESLREHYALTLRAWVAHLEANWDEAQALVGPQRARIWRLYMAACALNFEAGRTSIHQVLAVRKSRQGASGIPLRREEWLTSRATN